MDPILKAYNDLVGKNLITTKNYSIDEFRGWVNNDPRSSDRLWNLYKDNGLITTPDYSFEEFNGWLKGEPIKEDITQEPLATAFDKAPEINVEGQVDEGKVGTPYGRGMGNILPVFNSFKNWLKGVTYRDRKKIDSEISKQSEDFSPEDMDKIINGDKHDKQAEALANATPEDKKKAALIQYYKSMSMTDLLNPALGAKRAMESALEVDAAEETFHMNKEIDLISNAEPLYNKRLEELTAKMGADGESIKYLSNLIVDVARGKELNDEELNFYEGMVNQLEFHPEGSNILQLLERKRDLEIRRRDLPQQYKNAYVLEKIRKEDQLALDREVQSKSGWYNALLSVGKMLDEAPTELGAKVLGTLETNNPSIQMISSLDKDVHAWQATTKESRPSSENIADVEYDGEKFEVAFTDDGDVYNIYKDGYEFQGTEQEKESILLALNEQNPNHETRRKFNVSSVVRQAMDMATDQIGTIALGYALGGASLAVAGRSALASKILTNPLIAQSIPIMLQYTGTYAQQGVRDGGITNPDDLFKYAMGGAGLETFTEMFNPIEGVTINSLLRAGKPVNKFTRKSFDALTSGRRSTLQQALDFTKKTGAFLVEQGVKETVEEYMAEAGNFIQNEVYNKHFDANFENENPFTYENMRDIAAITSLVSVIPAAMSLRTDKSEITRQALLSGLKFPDVVESMAKHVSETNPERKANIDEFMSTFNRTKSLTSEFFEGDNKNVPTDFKETVSSLAFEIAKAENKKDADSLVKVKKGKEALEELSLKARYNIFDQTVHNIPSDQRSEVLAKVEEGLVNTDLSKMRGSTKLKFYNNLVNEALGLKTEPIKEFINKDLKDKFNAEVKTRIKQQRESDLSLEEIESNLIDAQDLKEYDIKDTAKNFYIKQAIKERRTFEEEERIKAFNQEVKRKKDIIENVLSKISKEDIVEYNGLEFTYKGIDSVGNPLLVTKDGARFESTPNNTITFEELNDGINKGEITFRKPPPVVTETPVTTTVTPEESTILEDDGESPEFKEFLRKKITGEAPPPIPPVDLDEDTVEEFIEGIYRNPHSAVGSNTRLAVLGKPYDEEVTVGDDYLDIERQDSSMVATEKAVELLDKNKYGPGTILEARVNDDPNTLVYDPFFPGVREITWGELKKQLPKNTLSGLPITIEDMIPIDLYKDNKKIPGNIHTIAWIDKNADNATKADEIEYTRRVRKEILDGNRELTISSHSYGRLNIGDNHNLSEDTPLVVFSKGVPIIGESKFTGEDGITYVETDQILIPISRPYLVEEEINTIIKFLRLSLGIDNNTDITKQLEKLGINIDNKRHVENFLSNFFAIDIPKSNENFNKLMAAKATQFYGKKKYVGVNIDKDGDSFSLLIGITDQNINGRFKTFKIKKTDRGHVVQTISDGKFVNTNISVDRMFNDLTKYLANKRLNHKDLKNLHFIDNEVRSVDYNKYLRSRLYTNVYFTPTKTGITPFFQPIIELESTFKPKAQTATTENIDDLIVDNFSPLSTDDNIGKYLEDYIIKGEPSQLVDEVATSILGLVYKDILAELKDRNLNTGTIRENAMFSMRGYSKAHKERLEEAYEKLKNEQVKKRIRSILDNWKVIENKAEITYDLKMSEFVEEIDEDNESISEQHNNDKFLTTDVLAESKPYIKAFFMFIPKPANKEGYNINLGDYTSELFRRYYTQEEVWNGVTDVLALRIGHYIEPKWKLYKAKILESNLEFKQEFVNLVENTLSNAQRHELVGRLYNSSRKMVLYRDNGMTTQGYRDYWQLNISSNTAKKKEQWINNFINSEFVTKTQETDDNGNIISKYSIDRKKYDEILKELRDNHADSAKLDYDVKLHVEKLKETFGKLGITLADRTYESLIAGRWSGNLFGRAKGGLLYSIIDSLDNRAILDNKNDVQISRLFKDNIFDRLAAFDLESGGDKSSRQVYSGDKVIQTLGPVRNYEKKLAQLIEGKSEIQKTAFARLSLWNSRNVFERKLDPVTAISYESTPIEAIRNESKGTGNIGYDSFTERDHIIYRLAIFEQASDLKLLNRRKYVTPPMEDKKNPFVITAPYYALKQDKKVDDTQNNGDYIDVLIEQLVISELFRMNNKITNAPAEYNPNNYYFIPELNNHAELRNTNFFIQKQAEQDLEGGLYNIKNWFVSFEENGKKSYPHYDLIRKIVQEHFDRVVAEEKKTWDKNGIYKFLPKKIKQKEDIEENLGLKDYVFNYMLFHANEAMNISGDPALFGKYNKPFEFSYGKVIDTLVNKQKRLAGENASIIPIAEPGLMRVLVVDDPKIPFTNKAFLSKYLSEEDIVKYEDEKKGSDASMLSTAQSYLSVLHRFNKITDSQFDNLSKKFENQSQDIKKKGFISKENLISDNDLEFILQPLKTMIHSKEVKDGIERISYIKMAEFPLIPQITQGFDIDKLRQLAEDSKVDKITFPSGFKLGSPQAIKIDLSKDDLGLTGVNPNESIAIISELGYGEQTENPQKESTKVVHGTQQAKLKFLNILDKVFKYKGKKITGAKLRIERDKLYDRLFELKYNKLIEEITTKDGEINYKKLEKIIRDELREFDPTYAYALQEDIIKDKVPLWLNPLFKRIQPKLLAIVEHRVTSVKVRGKSYVQAFSDLFRTKDITKTNIKVTRSFDGELKSITEKNGEIVGAQIMIPWMFKRSIKNYLDKEGYIDFNKIPKKVLEGTGFRIPTSGHNSITRFEIVGFLPKWMGNTVLLPSDILVQMGSDLDFDKFYSLFYNTVEISEGDQHAIIDIRDYNETTDFFGGQTTGNVSKFFNTITKEKDSEEKEIENELLDIDRAIYLSDDETVRKQNHTPINFGKLRKLADDIANEELKTKFISPLSPSYHIQKYLGGRVGKFGIGSFSIDNVFNAIIQGTNLSYMEYDETLFDYIDGEIDFLPNGKPYKIVSLTKEKVKKGKRLISDVYSAYQQAMLDNGKEQMSEKLNIIQDTMHFIRGMIQTGHEEPEIHELLAKPIIQELLNTVQLHSGYYNETYKNQRDIIADMLKKDPNNKDLLKYKAYYNIGASLAAIRGAMNIDSKGLMGSGWFPILKKEEIKKLENDGIGNFSGLEDLLFYPDGSRRYSYSAAKYGIAAAEQFYNDRLLPFREHALNKMITMIFRQLPEYLTNSTDKKIEAMEAIFDEWTKYFYSSFRRIFGVEDIKAERENLLLRDPLGNKINKIRQLTKEKNPNIVKIQNNLFIRNLEIDRTRGLTFVKILNNQLSDSAFDLQRAVKELYDNNYPLWDNYDTRKLVIDFYKYAYLVSGKQGPNEFMKYLPLDYIYDNEKIRGIIHTNLNEDTLIPEFNDEDTYSFLVQFFQHNPRFAAPQSLKEFNKTGSILVPKDTSKLYPVVFSIFKDDDLGNRQTLLYKKDVQGYIPIPKKGSYLYEMYDNELTKVDGDINREVKAKAGAEINVKKIVKTILVGGMVKPESPLYKFFDSFNKLDLDFKLVVDPSAPYKGKYRSAPIKTIIVKDINDYATLAHELSHAVTRSLTDDFYKNPDRLTSQQKKIISDIIKVYEKMYNDQSDEFKATVQRIAEKFKNRKEDESTSLDPNERIQYAFSSIQEFMSHVVDNSTGFRQWINDNYDNKKGKPNLFAQIRELFRQLLSTFIDSKTTVEFLEERILSLYETTKTENKEGYFPSVDSPYAVDPNRYNEPQEDVEPPKQKDKINKLEGEEQANAFPSIPQNISTYKNRFNNNIISSMDLIIQGLRTKTSRTKDEYVRYGTPKVGDYRWMEGKGKKVLTQITDVYVSPESNVKEKYGLRTLPIEEFKERVKLEGWEDSQLENLGRFPFHIEFKVVPETEGTTETDSTKESISGFQGYKGGFEDKGKGTPQGDGKDKAMREVANIFIGELSKTGKGSTFSSASEIAGKFGEKPVITPTSYIGGDENKAVKGIYSASLKVKGQKMVVMLARNGKLAGQELSIETEKKIKGIAEQGAEFVVGDMPNVDSQFIDYLQEIGAKFTIYHTGASSRIRINSKPNKIIEEFSPLDYQFDAVEKITSNLSTVEKLFKQQGNTDLFWNSIQQRLQIPKEQVSLFRDTFNSLEQPTIEQAIIDFVSNYSYTIEINTATEREKFYDNLSITYDEEGTEPIVTRESLEKKPTQYYSNLTVPGGTNYTENEIAIPGIEVEEKPQGTTVKSGVEELFDNNPELASIGTQEQYSQYLDSIFPDSKVKDIVYRSQAESGDSSRIHTGKYFSISKKYSEVYGKTYKVPTKEFLVNITNSKDLFVPHKKSIRYIENEIAGKKLDFQNLSKEDITLLKEYNYDGVIVTEEKFEELGIEETVGKEIIVFEPEQIHILGSKQDIEGFKEFIKNSALLENKIDTLRRLTPEQEANPFAVFILYSDGTNVAATTRDKGDSKFGLPGGKVDKGESPHDAAIREAREEGWDVQGNLQIVSSQFVEGKPVVWYEADSATPLTEYKEKSRGIKPIYVTLDQISNESGLGNWFIKNYIENKNIATQDDISKLPDCI